MKPSIKKIIIIVAVIAVLGIAYKYFFVKSAPAKPTSALTSSKTTTANTKVTSTTNKKVDKDTEFLTTLLSISKINVDATIFASPSFNSLQDNNVPIKNEETAGRVNPFAPFEMPEQNMTVETTNTNALKEIIPTKKN
ncbi:hypothetical protein IT400_03995 [Candidatus Nomurabacteria bacterium]|nr:hypothetical protein [Candidatus Nomurabacteria bacterium]